MSNDAFRLGYPYTLYYGQYNTDGFNRALKNQKMAWGHLEDHLKRHGTQYLVGDRVTLADICLATATSLLLKYALDTEFRKEFPTAEAYFHRLLSQEQFKKIFGEANFIEKFKAPTH
jgi:elongation factor 1-gamma